MQTKHREQKIMTNHTFHNVHPNQTKCRKANIPDETTRLKMIEIVLRHLHELLKPFLIFETFSSPVLSQV